MPACGSRSSRVALYRTRPRGRGRGRQTRATATVSTAPAPTPPTTSVATGLVSQSPGLYVPFPPVTSVSDLSVDQFVALVGQVVVNYHQQQHPSSTSVTVTSSLPHPPPANGVVTTPTTDGVTARVCTCVPSQGKYGEELYLMPHSVVMFLRSCVDVNAFLFTVCMLWGVGL